MRYEDIHPAFRNCLGFFEALRKLGFKADDIYVFLHKGMAHVMLKTQGKQFVCEAGPIECSDFAGEWERIGAALNTRGIPDEDLLRLYAECQAYTDSVGFMVALTAKGIVAPVVGDRSRLN